MTPSNSMSHGDRLSYIWSTINITGAALFFAAWNAGWVDLLLMGDQTYITHGIIVMFVGLLIYSFTQMLKLSVSLKSIDDLRTNFELSVTGKSTSERNRKAEKFAVELMMPSERLRQLGEFLVYIGLIGTVVGMILAFGAIKPDIGVEDINLILTEFLGGAKVALYTTLVGTLGYVWIKLNYMLLKFSLTSLYYETISGED